MMRERVPPESILTVMPAHSPRKSLCGIATSAHSRGRGNPDFAKLHGLSMGKGWFPASALEYAHIFECRSCGRLQGRRGRAVRYGLIVTPSPHPLPFGARE